LLKGDLTWLCALEDLVDEDCGATEVVVAIRAITDQTADFGIFRVSIN